VFTIIDIETCGGKFNSSSGKITEICILVHDGLSVVENYSTLINPECYISPLYTNITGITNQMVRNAPTFRDIARKVLQLTENKIFVAHNVSFDYNFICGEFAHLGHTFERQKLCTVQLSRKLMPGKQSYSLGKLCDSLGIGNRARHRAEGDAVATAQLFNLLLHLKSQHPSFKNKGITEMNVKTKAEKQKKILTP
jgi:DNA polymerase-3 subunit epsilon